MGGSGSERFSHSIHSLATPSDLRWTSILEVFSVLVDGLTRGVSALCGTIKVDDPDPVYIYERDLSNPEVISQDKCVVFIEAPCFMLYDSFKIDVKLRDPVQNFEVINGYLNDQRMSLTHGDISLYDRRLCSLVRGANGYGVFFYTVFEYACPAVVEVIFFSTNAAFVPANIYGWVSCRYNGDDHSTYVDKKYFKSSLFNKAKAESVQLTSSGSRIPLSKSLVPVPRNSSLSIEADLRATYVGSPKEELMSGTAEFDIRSGTICKIIGGADYYIEVSLNFENSAELIEDGCYD